MCALLAFSSISSAAPGPLASPSAAPAQDPFAGLNSDEGKYLVGVLQTYLRLRDGVRPSTDQLEHLSALDQFLGAFEPVRLENLTRSAGTSKDCQRFFNFYNTIGLQLAFDYGRYLRTPNLSHDIRTELAARLEILHLFETAAFSLILLKSEGGRSEIDPLQTSSCLLEPERSAWANAVFKSHVAANRLQESIFGEPAVSVPDPELADVQILASEYERQAQIHRTEVFGAELLVSIVAWEKLIQPYLDGVVGGIRVTPMGRFSRLMVAGLYGLGWVAIDRLLTSHLGFMSDQSSITDDETLSSWDRLLTLGERFLASDLDSPTLYLAYLQMMSELKTLQVNSFLQSNADIFKYAENKYGSVDAALSNLKEIYHE